MLNSFKLKNGVKVALYNIPTMRSFYASFLVKGGSIFDTQETSGVAHFMEHVICEGIPSLPDVEEFSDYIEKLAGSYNAATRLESIKFYLNIPKQYLDEALKIGSEVMLVPLFKESSIDKERSAILEEIRRRQDSVDYKNYTFFKSIRYQKNHPFLLDTGGSVEAVTNITKKDIVDYWQKFFYPENLYVVLVGNVDPNDAKKLLEKYFDNYDSKQKFPGFPKLSDKELSKKTVAIREDKELKTVYLDISFPSIGDEAPIKDRMIQNVIRTILGGLQGSRLNRLLRLKRGLVYGISVGAASFTGFGFVGISSQVVKENLDEVLDLITKEISTFVKDGPTPDELEVAKNYSINQTFMAFDHPSNIGSWVEGDLLWEDKIYLPEDVASIIESISYGDIMHFMQNHWNFDKLNLVLQGAIENTTVNKKKYGRIINGIK